MVPHCRLMLPLVGSKQTEAIWAGRLRSSPVKQHWSNSWCWQSWRWETIVQSCSFHYGPVQTAEGMSSPPCKLFAKGQTFGSDDKTTQREGGDSLEAKGRQFVSQHEPEAPKGQVFNAVLRGCDNQRQCCRIGSVSSKRAGRAAMKLLFIYFFADRQSTLLIVFWINWLVWSWLTSWNENTMKIHLLCELRPAFFAK